MDTKVGKVFWSIQQQLSSAPGLALPNVNKPFTLYVTEKQGQALGILTQSLGPKTRIVGYFSDSRLGGFGMASLLNGCSSYSSIS